jgi:hypothetical protein
VSERDDLLLILGLPVQASAREIEFAYLEKRAEIAKRLQQGDAHASVQLEQLDRIYSALEAAGALERPVETDLHSAAPAPGLFAEQRVVAPPAAPPAALPAQAPLSRGSGWESAGALVCGIAALLVVCWLLYFYRNDLSKPSAEVLVLLGDPLCYVVFLLALAAEMLAHTEIQAMMHAYYLARSSGERPTLLDERRMSRARLERRLGRLAAASVIIVTFLMGVSFFRAIGQRA